MEDWHSGMIVYNPASPTVAERVRALILAKAE